MLTLLIIILSTVAILLCFKLFNRFNINTLLAIVVNYFVAAGFGFALERQRLSFSELPDKPWILMAVVLGILLILGFNLFALSTKKAGMTITAMAARLSLLIPVSLGLIFFNEQATLSKITGVILTIAALSLTLINDKKGSAKITVMMLPVFLFIINGMVDSTLKISQYYYIKDDYILFLASGFFISLLIGVIILIFNYKKLQTYAVGKTILAGLILGLLNWLSTYYMLKAMSTFDISGFLPLVNVNVVSLAAILEYTLFKEKLKPINVLGLFLAVFAILLLGYNM